MVSSTSNVINWRKNNKEKYNDYMKSLMQRKRKKITNKNVKITNKIKEKPEITNRLIDPMEIAINRSY